MPYCTNCGNEMTNDQEYCTYCGRKQTINEPQQPYYQGVNPNNQTKEETSNTALLFGILGLFIAGIIFGILAIVLSNNTEQKNKSTARTLGIIDIVFAIISSILLYQFI